MDPSRSFFPTRVVAHARLLCTAPTFAQTVLIPPVRFPMALKDTWAFIWPKKVIALVCSETDNDFPCTEDKGVTRGLSSATPW